PGLPAGLLAWHSQVRYTGNPTGVPGRLLFATSSLYDDFPDHMWMQAAEIFERAGTGEGVGKRVVSVERLRAEGLVLVDHIGGDVVVIDPLHCRSHGNRQFRGGEGEVVDRNDIFLLRCDRAERQQRADD